MTLRKQIEECKRTEESFSKEIETEYYDMNMSMFQARATLEIEPCGDWQISVYDYYDTEKEEWIDTEERNEWTEEVIDREFFQSTRKETVEQQAKTFLYQQIKTRCGGDCDNPENYIQEFFWKKSCLYASIDKLSNPVLIATIEKGVIA